MGISINPFSVIIKGVVRIFELLFKHITFCHSSCCQSECRGRNGQQSKKSSSV